MSDLDWLAGRFEENRPRLRAVAYRMLGSAGEAEDAVQETWLRVSRADADEVENLAGWLTTITARVCLNMLQARKARPEEPVGAYPPDPGGHQDGQDPAHQAVLAESLGQALLVVLNTLAPAERVAFVLHDMFAVPFEEIAPIVDRSPAVAAFLTASQHGDFTALLEMLDPGVMLRTDQAAARIGAPDKVRGTISVAEIFSGRAQGAQLALVNDTAGIVWAPGGRLQVVFTFTITGGKITAIDMIADPDRIGQFDVAILD